MCSSLVSILASMSDNRSIASKVRVTINDTYIGDIKRSFLVLLLSNMGYDVGDIITLEQSYDGDGYYDRWSYTSDMEPHVIYFSRDGWIAGEAPYYLAADEAPKSDKLPRIPEVSHIISSVKYAKSDRKWGVCEGFGYYKRQAARAVRRCNRAIIEEGMVG